MAEPLPFEEAAIDRMKKMAKHVELLEQLNSQLEKKSGILEGLFDTQDEMIQLLQETNQLRQKEYQKQKKQMKQLKKLNKKKINQHEEKITRQEAAIEIMWTLLKNSMDKAELKKRLQEVVDKQEKEKENDSDEVKIASTRELINWLDYEEQQQDDNKQQNNE